MTGDPGSPAPRPAPRRTLGLGVIGCGYWGTNLVRNFAALPEARLRALADLSPERRDIMAARYPDAAVMDDHRRLLSRSDIQAVAICTPPATHRFLAVEALAAGKHVLVEKPLATSVADADAMIAAASAAGRILMVGHTFVYNPAVELLASLVRDGALGRIYYLRATRVNLGLFQRDVNVLWDLAPHDLSILETVLGQNPERIRAWGQAFVHPDQVDVASLNLGYAGGLTALTHVSWLDPCKIRRVTVVGDQKMAVYDDLEPLDKIKIYDRGVERPPYAESFGEFQLSYRYGDVHAPRLRWTEPLRRECAHFIACARDGAPPRSDGPSGRRVVALLEAADRSLASGGAEIAMDGERG
jgi:predicted dehydrogenase